MTKEEWLNVGYSNKIIDVFDISEDVYFYEVYQKWFLFKLGLMKPQSADRIEVTFKRYFNGYNKLLHEVTEIEIINFLNKVILEYNVYLKELYRIKQIFRDVLAYALDYGYSTANDINWDKVNRNIKYNNLSKSDKKEYCIDDTVKKKLFKSVIDENVYPTKRSAALMIVANFYMGLRIGELSSLQWSDVDFKHKVINVQHTYAKSFLRDDFGQRISQYTYIEDDLKTVNSFRQVPITKECMYILLLLKEHHIDKGYTSPYLCYDGKDIVLFNSVERTLRHLCNICNIPYFNSHLIRKSVATELHNKGVPTKVISDILGHNEISTTEKCYILSNGNINDVRNIMDKALKVNLAHS